MELMFICFVSFISLSFTLLTILASSLYVGLRWMSRVGEKEPDSCSFGFSRKALDISLNEASLEM